ncbi:hypothetical protein HZ326_7477 [Fusarium oxysporum f. sp. albedinis]|nr:hypothetical protein HZ326_7477 [Fusarium oxysporum f. sp. albedinis]
MAGSTFVHSILFPCLRNQSEANHRQTLAFLRSLSLKNPTQCDTTVGLSLACDASSFNGLRNGMLYSLMSMEVVRFEGTFTKPNHTLSFCLHFDFQGKCKAPFCWNMYIVLGIIIPQQVLLRSCFPSRVLPVVGRAPSGLRLLFKSMIRRISYPQRLKSRTLVTLSLSKA